MAKYKHNTTNTSFHFKYTTAKTNLVYRCTAEAIDEDSLHSPSSVPVEVKINGTPEKPSILTLKPKYDSKEKTIKLNWQYETNGDYFFILYRSIGNAHCNGCNHSIKSWMNIKIAMLYPEKIIIMPYRQSIKMHTVIQN